MQVHVLYFEPDGLYDVSPYAPTLSEVLRATTYSRKEVEGDSQYIWLGPLNAAVVVAAVGERQARVRFRGKYEYDYFPVGPILRLLLDAIADEDVEVLEKYS